MKCISKDNAKSFLEYSGELRLYSLHHVDGSELGNPFMMKKWEYAVAFFDKELSDVVSDFVKASLISQPKQTKNTPVFLKLCNHNTFIVWVRHKYNIDMLKIEREMNEEYMKNIEESENSDSDEEITYTMPTIDATPVTEVKKKISLLVIASDDENNESSFSSSDEDD